MQKTQKEEILKQGLDPKTILQGNQSKDKFKTGILSGLDNEPLKEMTLMNEHIIEFYGDMLGESILITSLFGNITRRRQTNKQWDVASIGM